MDNLSLECNLAPKLNKQSSQLPAQCPGCAAELQFDSLQPWHFKPDKPLWPLPAFVQISALQRPRDRSVQKWDWNGHSTTENIPHKSYSVNHLQKGTPRAKQDTQQKILLESCGARWVLDMLLPNTLGLPRDRG